MAELTTIARPYAQAAFERALETRSLDSWQQSLTGLAAISQQTDLPVLFKNPKVSASELVKLLLELSGNSSQEFANFLTLLAGASRLNALAAIAELFIHYRAEHEQTLDVSVTSAVELDKTQKTKLGQVLERKFGRKVRLNYTTDSQLLAGVIVRADDQVIDGSLRGRLNSLADALHS